MELNQVWVDDFFGDISDDLILRRRETGTIEFKKVFDWSNKEFKSSIAKTAAAFSNREGGLIIFGIEDKPHYILGIDSFDNVDDADISVFFNETFTPSIVFSRHVYQIRGKLIGIINIRESKNKPVICIKDSSKTFDSDIYYRYSARSAKIKSGDLLYLMNEVREKDKTKWLDMLSNIANVGVENIAVLNSISGELTSANKNTFLIDESILSQIQILDKYPEADEGSPAVRIIGDVVTSAKVIEKTNNIFEEHIFLAFLSGDLKCNSIDYVSAILRLNSEYYPIYLFLDKANIDKNDRFDEVNLIQARSKNKANVLKRINDDSKLATKKNSYSFTSAKWGQARKKFHDDLINSRQINVTTEDECKVVLESVFSLEGNMFDTEFVKAQLLEIFNKFYPYKKDGINYTFRWALAYLDNVIYS